MQPSQNPPTQEQGQSVIDIKVPTDTSITPTPVPVPVPNNYPAPLSTPQGGVQSIQVGDNTMSAPVVSSANNKPKAVADTKQTTTSQTPKPYILDISPINQKAVNSISSVLQDKVKAPSSSMYQQFSPAEDAFNDLFQEIFNVKNASGKTQKVRGEDLSTLFTNKAKEKYKTNLLALGAELPEDFEGMSIETLRESIVEIADSIDDTTEKNKFLSLALSNLPTASNTLEDDLSKIMGIPLSQNKEYFSVAENVAKELDLLEQEFERLTIDGLITSESSSSNPDLVNNQYERYLMQYPQLNAFIKSGVRIPAIERILGSKYTISLWPEEDKAEIVNQNNLNIDVTPGARSDISGVKLAKEAELRQDKRKEIESEFDPIEQVAPQIKQSSTLQAEILKTVDETIAQDPVLSSVPGMIASYTEDMVILNTTELKNKKYFDLVPVFIETSDLYAKAVQDNNRIVESLNEINSKLEAAQEEYETFIIQNPLEYANATEKDKKAQEEFKAKKEALTAKKEELTQELELLKKDKKDAEGKEVLGLESLSRKYNTEKETITELETEEIKKYKEIIKKYNEDYISQLNTNQEKYFKERQRLYESDPRYIEYNSTLNNINNYLVDAYINHPIKNFFDYVASKNGISINPKDPESIKKGIEETMKFFNSEMFESYIIGKENTESYNFLNNQKYVPDINELSQLMEDNIAYDLYDLLTSKSYVNGSVNTKILYIAEYYSKWTSSQNAYGTGNTQDFASVNDLLESLNKKGFIYPSIIEQSAKNDAQSIINRIENLRKEKEISLSKLPEGVEQVTRIPDTDIISDGYGNTLNPEERNYIIAEKLARFTIELSDSGAYQGFIQTVKEFTEGVYDVTRINPYAYIPFISSIVDGAEKGVIYKILEKDKNGEILSQDESIILEAFSLNQINEEIVGDRRAYNIGKDGFTTLVSYMGMMGGTFRIASLAKEGVKKVLDYGVKHSLRAADKEGISTIMKTVFNKTGALASNKLVSSFISEFAFWQAQNLAVGSLMAYSDYWRRLAEGAYVDINQYVEIGKTEMIYDQFNADESALRKAIISSSIETGSENLSTYVDPFMLSTGRSLMGAMGNAIFNLVPGGSTIKKLRFINSLGVNRLKRGVQNSLLANYITYGAKALLWRPQGPTRQVIGTGLSEIGLEEGVSMIANHYLVEANPEFAESPSKAMENLLYDSALVFSPLHMLGLPVGAYVELRKAHILANITSYRGLNTLILNPTDLEKVKRSGFSLFGAFNVRKAEIEKYKAGFQILKSLTFEDIDDVEKMKEVETLLSDLSGKLNTSSNALVSLAREFAQTHESKTQDGHRFDTFGQYFSEYTKDKQKLLSLINEAATKNEGTAGSKIAELGRNSIFSEIKDSAEHYNDTLYNYYSLSEDEQKKISFYDYYASSSNAIKFIDEQLNNFERNKVPTNISQLIDILDALNLDKSTFESLRTRIAQANNEIMQNPSLNTNIVLDYSRAGIEGAQADMIQARKDKDESYRIKEPDMFFEEDANGDFVATKDASGTLLTQDEFANNIISRIKRGANNAIQNARVLYNLAKLPISEAHKEAILESIKNTYEEAIGNNDSANSVMRSLSLYNMGLSSLNKGDKKAEVTKSFIDYLRQRFNYDKDDKKYYVNANDARNLRKILNTLYAMSFAVDNNSINREYFKIKEIEGLNLDEFSSDTETDLDSETEANVITTLLDVADRSSDIYGTKFNFAGFTEKQALKQMVSLFEEYQNYSKADAQMMAKLVIRMAKSLMRTYPTAYDSFEKVANELPHLRWLQMAAEVPDIELAKNLFSSIQNKNIKVVSEKEFNKFKEGLAKRFGSALVFITREEAKTILIENGHSSIEDMPEESLLKSRDGQEIFGFHHKGRVFIEPSRLNYNTLFHEVGGHIYSKLIKEAADKGDASAKAVWEKFKDILYNTELGRQYYQSIKSEYGNLSESSEEEVFAQMLGDIASSYMEKATSSIPGFSMLQDLYEKVVQWFASRFGNLYGKSVEEINAMNTGQFFGAVASDVISGNIPSEVVELVVNKNNKDLLEIKKEKAEKDAEKHLVNNINELLTKLGIDKIKSNIDFSLYPQTEKIVKDVFGNSNMKIIRSVMNSAYGIIAKYEGNKEKIKEETKKLQEFLNQYIPVKSHIPDILEFYGVDLDKLYTSKESSNLISKVAPEELLKRAGYKSDTANTTEEARGKFLHFYTGPGAKDESYGRSIICTMQETSTIARRKETYNLLWIIKDDAENIPRATVLRSLPNPSNLSADQVHPLWREYLENKGRKNSDGTYNAENLNNNDEDPFSTSVLLIMMAHDGYSRNKLVSRYNHEIEEAETVGNTADFVYGADYDRIINGLNSSLENKWNTRKNTIFSKDVDGIKKIGHGELTTFVKYWRKEDVALRHIDIEYTYGDGFYMLDNSLYLLDPLTERMVGGIIFKQGSAEKGDDLFRTPLANFEAFHDNFTLDYLLTRYTFNNNKIKSVRFGPNNQVIIKADITSAEIFETHLNNYKVIDSVDRYFDSKEEAYSFYESLLSEEEIIIDTKYGAVKAGVQVSEKIKSEILSNEGLLIKNKDNYELSNFSSDNKFSALIPSNVKKVNTSVLRNDTDDSKVYIDDIDFIEEAEYLVLNSKYLNSAQNLKIVETLNINSSNKLKDLPSLEVVKEILEITSNNIKTLSSLRIANTIKASGSTIESLPNLETVNKLNVSYTSSLNNLDKLKYIIETGNFKNSSITSLPSLKRAKKLDLELSNVENIENLEYVSTLNANNSSLKNLKSLKYAKELKLFNSPIENLDSLEEVIILDLSRTQNLYDVPKLKIGTIITLKDSNALNFPSLKLAMNIYTDDNYLLEINPTKRLFVPNLEGVRSISDTVNLYAPNLKIYLDKYRLIFADRLEFEKLKNLEFAESLSYNRKDSIVNIMKNKYQFLSDNDLQEIDLYSIVSVEPSPSNKGAYAKTFAPNVLAKIGLEELDKISDFYSLISNEKIKLPRLKSTYVTESSRNYIDVNESAIIKTLNSGLDEEYEKIKEFYQKQLNNDFTEESKKIILFTHFQDYLNFKTSYLVDFDIEVFNVEKGSKLTEEQLYYLDKNIKDFLIFLGINKSLKENLFNDLYEGVIKDYYDGLTPLERQFNLFDRFLNHYLETDKSGLTTPMKEVIFSKDIDFSVSKVSHGTPHKFPAERLVQYEDGTKQYIQGSVDKLPEIPKGATVIKNYPLGRFRLDKIGTGEGAQAFGWGLYFADLESIAKKYTERLGGADLLVDGKIIKRSDGFEVFTAANGVATYGYERALERNIELLNEGYLEASTMNKVIDEIKKLKGKRVELKNKGVTYKATLHKGKTPDQYTWLEWYNQLNIKLLSKIKNNFKENRDNFKRAELYSQQDKYLRQYYDSLLEGIEAVKINSNSDLYKRLSVLFGSDKQASLFLLEMGIDGIKYPAESIARGATSDTARGFNYVVFDENAIEIEERIDFSISSKSFSNRIDKATVFTSGITLKTSSFYEDAKRGDLDSAEKLVELFVKEEKLVSLKNTFGEDIIVVSPIKEKEFANKIPFAFAQMLSKELGWKNEPVIQSESSSTGKARIAKILNRVKFSPVVKRDKKYVIADDYLTTGTTVRALRDSIESQGGKVVGIVGLASSPGGINIDVKDETLKSLDSKFNLKTLDVVLQRMGVGPSHMLTEVQAQRILGYKNLTAFQNDAAPVISEMGEELPFPTEELEKNTILQNDKKSFVKGDFRILGGKEVFLKNKVFNNFFFNAVKKSKRFIDAFAGSGVISNNVEKRTNTPVIKNYLPQKAELLQYIKDNKDEFVKNIKDIISYALDAKRKHESPSDLRNDIYNKFKKNTNELIFLANYTNTRNQEVLTSKDLTTRNWSIDLANFNQKLEGTVLEAIKNISNSNANVSSKDGWQLLSEATKGDLIVVDPPYHGDESAIYSKKQSINNIAKVPQLVNAKDKGASIIYFDIADRFLINELQAAGFNTYVVQRVNSTIQEVMAIANLDLPEELKENTQVDYSLIGKGGPSGMYNRSENLITLFGNSNPITLMHELGHWYLQAIGKAAADGNREAAADINELIASWKKIKDVELSKKDKNKNPRLKELMERNLQIEDEMFEYFSFAIESYLTNSKSPFDQEKKKIKSKLGGVFKRFIKWATEIFDGVNFDKKLLEIPLSPEVINMMNQMLEIDVRNYSLKDYIKENYAGVKKDKLVTKEFLLELVGVINSGKIYDYNLSDAMDLLHKFTMFYKKNYLAKNFKSKSLVLTKELTRIATTPRYKSADSYVKEIEFLEKFINDSSFRTKIASLSEMKKRALRAAAKYSDRPDFYRVIRDLARMPHQILETIDDVDLFMTLINSNPLRISVEEIKNSAEYFYSKDRDYKRSKTNRLSPGKRLWATNLEVAKQMLQAKTDMKDIVKETGWFINNKGKWEKQPLSKVSAAFERMDEYSEYESELEMLNAINEATWYGEREDIRNLMMAVATISDIKDDIGQRFLKVELENIHPDQYKEFRALLVEMAKNKVANQAMAEFVIKYEAQVADARIKSVANEKYLNKLRQASSRGFFKREFLSNWSSLGFMINEDGKVELSLGNLSRWNIQQILDFVDGLTDDFSGEVVSIVHNPMEEAFNAHRLNMYNILQEMDAAKEKINSVGLLSLAGIIWNLEQIPDVIIDLDRNGGIQIVTGFDENGQEVKEYVYGGDEPLLQENWSFLTEAEKQELMDNPVISANEFYQVIAGQAILKTDVDTESARYKIFEDMRRRKMLNIAASIIYSFGETPGRFIKEYESQNSNHERDLSQRYEKLFYTDYENHVKDSRKEILGKTGYSSIGKLVMDIFEGRFLLEDFENLPAKDIRDYIEKGRKVFSDIYEGEYTNGRSMEYTSQMYSGKKFHRILNYAPLIRYDDYKAKQEKEGIIEMPDESGQYLPGEYAILNSSLRTNSNFLNSRTPVVSLVELNAHEMLKKRAEQEMFYMTQEPHKKFLDELFKIKNGFFSNEDSLHSDEIDPDSKLDKYTANYVRNMVANFYLRGMTASKMKLRDSYLRAPAEIITQFRAIALGSIVQAPGQVTAALAAQPEMYGDISSYFGNMAYAFQLTLSDEDAVNDFLINNAPEIAFRGVTDFDLGTSVVYNLKLKDLLSPSFKYESEYEKDKNYVGHLARMWGNKKERRRNFTKNTLLPMMFFDRLAARVSFLAAYKSYLDEYGLEFDFKNPHKEAIKHAIQVVRKSQNTDSELFKPGVAFGIHSAYKDNSFKRNVLNQRIDAPIGEILTKESAFHELFRQQYWSFKSFSVNEQQNLRRNILKGFDMMERGDSGGASSIALTLGMQYMSRVLFELSKSVISYVFLGVGMTAMYASGAMGDGVDDEDDSDLLSQYINNPSISKSWNLWKSDWVATQKKMQDFKSSDFASDPDGNVKRLKSGWEQIKKFFDVDYHMIKSLRDFGGVNSGLNILFGMLNFGLKTHFETTNTDTLRREINPNISYLFDYTPEDAAGFGLSVATDLSNSISSMYRAGIDVAKLHNSDPSLSYMELMKHYYKENPELWKSLVKTGALAKYFTMGSMNIGINTPFLRTSDMFRMLNQISKSSEFRKSEVGTDYRGKKISDTNSYISPMDQDVEE